MNEVCPACGELLEEIGMGMYGCINCMAVFRKDDIAEELEEAFW